MRLQNLRGGWDGDGDQKTKTEQQQKQNQNPNQKNPQTKPKQTEISKVWNLGGINPLPYLMFLGIHSGVRSKSSLWQSQSRCFHSDSFKSNLGAVLAQWVLLAGAGIVQAGFSAFFQKYRQFLTETGGGSYCRHPNEMLIASTKQGLYLGNEQGEGEESLQKTQWRLRVRISEGYFVG